MSEPIKFHKLRDFGAKMNATIEFIKQNFKSLFKYIFYFAGPFILIGSLFMATLLGDYFRLISQSVNGTGDLLEGEIFQKLGFAFVGIIIILIGVTVLIAVVYEFMKHYEKNNGNPPATDELLAEVKKSFWKVLGTSIVYFIGFLVLYALILIPIFIVGGAGSGVAFAVLLIFVLGIGMIYLAISFTLVYIIRVYEDVPVLKAFQRSLYLVKSKWWSTFGIVVIASLIQSITSYIFAIPWYTTTIFSQLHSVETGEMSDPGLLQQVISHASFAFYMLASYSLYSIPLVAIAFQYFNLRERKEAKGLMDQIDTFGKTDDQTDDEEHY